MTADKFTLTATLPDGRRAPVLRPNTPRSRDQARALLREAERRLKREGCTVQSKEFGDTLVATWQGQRARLDVEAVGEWMEEYDCAS